MPAVLTITTSGVPAGGVELRSWQIAMPGSENNRFVIDAYLGGPEPAPLRGTVDSIVKALALTPPVTPLPTGSARDVAARAATKAALADLDSSARDNSGSTFYSCFPAQPGTSNRATILDGPYAPLGRSIPVTCSTNIRASELQVWELTLSATWKAGVGYPAGSTSETFLVGQDGMVGSSRGAGGFPDPPVPPSWAVPQAQAEAAAVVFAEVGHASHVCVVNSTIGRAGDYEGIPVDFPTDAVVWVVTVHRDLTVYYPDQVPGASPCAGPPMVKILVGAETGKAGTIVPVPSAPASSTWTPAP